MKSHWFFLVILPKSFGFVVTNLGPNDYEENEAVVIKVYSSYNCSDYSSGVGEKLMLFIKFIASLHSQDVF